MAETESLRSYFNKKDATSVTCKLCKKDIKAAKGQYNIIPISVFA